MSMAAAPTDKAKSQAAASLNKKLVSYFSRIDKQFAVDRAVGATESLAIRQGFSSS